jgi:hypothetical protein
LRSGDGKKTVYARYKSRSGRVIVRSDTVILDTHRPTGTFALAGGAAQFGSRTVTGRATPPGSVATPPR